MMGGPMPRQALITTSQYVHKMQNPIVLESTDTKLDDLHHRNVPHRIPRGVRAMRPVTFGASIMLPIAGVIKRGIAKFKPISVSTLKGNNVTSGPLCERRAIQYSEYNPNGYIDEPASLHT